VTVYPLGAGEARVLPANGLTAQSAIWHPDGNRIVLQASEQGRGARLYLQDVAGGKARPFTPENYRALGRRSLSPDGKSILVAGPDRKVYLYPVEGGEPIPLPALTFQDVGVSWTPDGRFLYFSRRGELPLKVYRFDLRSGAKEFVREVMPSDPAGVGGVGPVLMLPDQKSYVFGYNRILSDLHVVDGLK
jgi:Tol biopolymer transport system component